MQSVINNFKWVALVSSWPQSIWMRNVFLNTSSSYYEYIMAQFSNGAGLALCWDKMDDQFNCQKNQ